MARHHRPFAQEPFHVHLGESVGRDDFGMLRSDDHHRLSRQVEVVRPGCCQGAGDGQEDFLAGAAEVVVDIVGPFDAEHRDVAVGRVETQFLVVGRPGARLVVLGEAKGVLGGRSHGRPVQRAGGRTADVGEHEADGATDGGVGLAALPEGVVRPVHLEFASHASANEACHGARMRRRLQGLEVEALVDHGPDRGDNDGKVRRFAARHDRVCRHLTQGCLAQSGFDPPGHLGGIPPGKHRLDAPWRGRQHRQPVRPATSVEQAVHGFDGVRPLERRRGIRRVELALEERPIAPPASRLDGLVAVFRCQRAWIVGQRLGNLPKDMPSEFPAFLCVAFRQGMRHDGQRQAGHVPAHGFGLRQGEELVGTHGHRGDAAFLEFDTVMDTPRRAGSSVADRAHHRVATVDELVRERRRLGRFLAEPEEPLDAVGRSKPTL